ncbi:transposase [Azospirillum sp. sgz301742]
MIDSRTCPSAPSCFARSVDGGKKIHGIKIHLGVDKYGLALAVDASPANEHDTKGILPHPPRAAPTRRRRLPGVGDQRPRLPWRTPRQRR